MPLFTAKYTDQALAFSPELGVLASMALNERRRGASWQSSGEGDFSLSSPGKLRGPQACLCICLCSSRQLPTFLWAAVSSSGRW